MLMEILGIVIGFCSVMLIFSLLVTAIVHAIQGALSLRAKNMQQVIGHFIDQIDNVDTKKVLRYIDRQVPDGIHSSLMPKLRFGAMNLKPSAISLSELLHFVERSMDDETDKEPIKQKISHSFVYIEHIMHERFKMWMHQISIVVAFIIAFCFQLSTFDLIKKLSNDSTSLAKLTAYAESYDLQSGTTALSATQAAVQLTSLDFELFHQGPEYYLSLDLVNALPYVTPNPSSIDVSIVRAFQNWLGVIFSAIFISLGAPFWFNTLRTAASLKDQLTASNK